MMQQQQQEVTPQIFSQTMGQLKRRIAQVQGETQQMNADTMTETLNQVMQMVNGVFQQSAQKDKLIKEVQENLDKAYNAHPELKVIIEAPPDAKSKAKKV